MLQKNPSMQCNIESLALHRPWRHLQCNKFEKKKKNRYAKTLTKLLIRNNSGRKPWIPVSLINVELRTYAIVRMQHLLFKSYSWLILVINKYAAYTHTQTLVDWFRVISQKDLSYLVNVLGTYSRTRTRIKDVIYSSVIDFDLDLVFIGHFVKRRIGLCRCTSTYIEHGNFIIENFIITRMPFFLVSLNFFPYDVPMYRYHMSVFVVAIVLFVQVVGSVNFPYGFFHPKLYRLIRSM